MAVNPGRTPRRCSTICLPFDQKAHEQAVADPAAFRAALDRLFLDAPESFPEGLAAGYHLKESRASRGLGPRQRRIRLKATSESFTASPPPPARAVAWARLQRKRLVRKTFRRPTASSGRRPRACSPVIRQRR